MMTMHCGKKVFLSFIHREKSLVVASASIPGSLDVCKKVNILCVQEIVTPNKIKEICSDNIKYYCVYKKLLLLKKL